MTSEIFATDAINNDAEATIEVSGGIEPYTYAWSNGRTTQTITGLAPGTYSVIVTDANSQTTSNSVIVVQFVYTNQQAESANDQCCIARKGFKFLNRYIKGKDCEEQKDDLQFLIGAKKELDRYLSAGTTVFDYAIDNSFIGDFRLICGFPPDDNLTYTATLTSAVGGLIATFYPAVIANTSNPFSTIIAYFINQLNQSGLWTAIPDTSIPHGMIVTVCEPAFQNDIFTIHVVVTGFSTCIVANGGGWSWNGSTHTATYNDDEPFTPVTHIQTDDNCLSADEIKNIEKVLCQCNC